MLGLFKKLTKKKEMIKLSPTGGLNLFAECPHCFWVKYNENKLRPRGIYPSLPSGMDDILKTYLDKYRGKLPPELKGKVPGKLVADKNLIKVFRNPFSGLEYKDIETGAALRGGLDDCLVDKRGNYSPLDIKTRGWAPKEGQSEQFYQTQLDSYSLLLDFNGYPVSKFGYLVYYYPKEGKTNGNIKFNVEVVKIRTDVLRVKQLFINAVKILNGPKPIPSFYCEHCRYRNGLNPTKIKESVYKKNVQNKNK